jgi:hypothetical protein
MSGEPPTGASLLAVFPSLNQVAVIRRRLYRDGVFVEMTRTPQCLAHTGCSFALRCSVQELDRVREVCQELGIAIGGVFAETATAEGPEYAEFSGPKASS